MQSIADEAGVARMTVYQAFGEKRSVLKASLDVVKTGDPAQRSLLHRDWVERALAESDVERRRRITYSTAAGRRRREHARMTRQRILDAATRLFSERGYARTTVESIADHASVAPATVYQVFGNKQSILAAAVAAATAAAEVDGSVLDASLIRQARDESDVESRLSLIVAHVADIEARAAPIREVLRDAASMEPELTALIAGDHNRRRATGEALAGILLGADADDSHTRDVADTWFALVNGDTYRLLVGHLGWTGGQWREWLFRQLRCIVVR